MLALVTATLAGPALPEQTVQAQGAAAAAAATQVLMHASEGTRTTHLSSTARSAVGGALVAALVGAEVLRGRNRRPASSRAQGRRPASRGSGR